MKKFLIILLLALAAAAGWYAYQMRPKGDGALRLSGNIEAVTVDIAFKIPGRVIRRNVDEGNDVATDKVVAELESEDLKAAVAVRKAALGVATVERDRAKLFLDRSQRLMGQDRGAISQEQYDQDLATYNSAVARVEQAKASLNAAQVQLSYASVVSPLNGVVLSKNTEPGEFVAPGTPIVTVADIENVWLRAYVDEHDVGSHRVKWGQPVEVTTDTYPGKVYEGRISFISSQEEFTPKTVQTEKERVKLVYRIKIDVKNPKRELKPGMPADARILEGETTAGPASVPHQP